MSATTIREAPGWSYALCRAECDDCGWTGPVRNTDSSHGNALLTVDKRRHQCDDDASAGAGDVEQALELRSRIRHAIEQGDGSVTGEQFRMDTAETTLHFRWMGHDYVLTITDQTPEGT